MTALTEAHGGGVAAELLARLRGSEERRAGGYLGRSAGRGRQLGGAGPAPERGADPGAFWERPWKVHVTVGQKQAPEMEPCVSGNMD